MQVIEIQGAKVGDYAIGFANVRHTLWRVEEVGALKCVSFVKILGANFDDAKRAYPDAHFVPELRGRERYALIDGIKTTQDVEMPLVAPKPYVFAMPWGKYEGKHLDEIDDYDYLAWLSRECYDARIKLLVRGYLLERKADFVTIVEGDVFTKKEMEKRAAIEDSRANNAKAEEIRQAIANGTEVELELVTNGKELRLGCDYHVALDSDGNEIAFESAQGFIYNGYTYYLPCDAKDKCHRVKGKTIVAKVTTGNRGEFLVTDYRIKK